MFDKIALDGFWLLSGFGLFYLLGVFTSQWLKDKISGTPATLRSALSATESSAKAELQKAEAAVIADVGNLFHKAATAVAAAAPPAVAVAAAPAAPAAAAAPAVAKS